MLRNFLLVFSTAVFAVAIAHGSGVLKPEEQAIVMARQALGETLGVAPDTIELETVSAVDWSDAGLGCHKEGFGYAQVITPGFRIGLRAAGKTYAVHVGGGQAVVCQGGEKAAKTVAGSELAKALQLARQDLLRRLEVAEDSIRVKGIKRGAWKDRPAQCHSDATKISAETNGFFVQLMANEMVFLYFADAHQVVACSEGNAG